MVEHHERQRGVCSGVWRVVLCGPARQWGSFRDAQANSLCTKLHPSVHKEPCLVVSHRRLREKLQIRAFLARMSTAGLAACSLNHISAVLMASPR